MLEQKDLSHVACIVYIFFRSLSKYVIKSSEIKDITLPITFSPIMCLAQHLTITFICWSSFAPSLYMVGIHL